MSDEQKCPKCGSEHTYPDQALWVCTECANEWSPGAAPAASESPEPSGLDIRDAHGNALQDGDSVTVIKDLKVKGAGSAVKVGTKVKNIRLVESSDGHNISCKVDGIGAMYLKSEFVKKS